MKNRTIAQYITLAAIIIAAITGLMAALSVIAISSLTGSTDSLAQRALPALSQLSKIDQPLGDLRRLVALESSAKDADEAHSYESDINAAIEAIRKQESEYQKVSSEPQDRALNHSFESALDPLSTAVSEVSDLSRQGKKDDALLAFHKDFAPAMDAVIDLERRRTTERLDRASEMAKTAGHFAQSSLIAIWAVTGVALLGVVLVCLYSRGQVSHKLSALIGSFEDNAARLAACVSQVSLSSHTLSNGSSQQASSMEEISSSVEQMNAMTRRNSENSVRASSMMTDTAEQISRSNTALKDMIASMDAIKASSEKVAKINRTIDEIAFQTNILALNAAVEAARAGDAGMGFAVVADEVRNLAQRSAVAAKDTALLIEEAIENTQKGSYRLDQVASVIKAITEGAGQVSHLLEEVKEASSQQAQGVAQISQAILHVNRITQQAAAGAEASAAASEDLSQQSRSIQQAIQSLQALAGFVKSHEVGTPGSEPQEANRPAPAVFAKAPAAKFDSLKKVGAVHAPSRVDSPDPEDFLPMEKADDVPSHTFTSF